MLEPGARVDRYLVESFLGEGGAAVVWRVRHEALGTSFALKVLRVPSPGVVARLLREGRAMGAVAHRNLLGVHDLVEIDGVPALVVELANGPSLAEVLGRGLLPPAEATRLGAQILAGLAAAHAAGLVHRDVKPGNVLLDVSGGGVTAKLADFGLAKVLRDAAPAHVTRDGATLGTPDYMAPEQFGGAADADARADVYAAAVVLYELFTGQLPFPDMAPAARLRQSLDEPDRAPALLYELPPRLASQVRSALATDPAARPADAGALLAAWAPEDPGPSDPAFLATLERSPPPPVDTPSWNATIPTSVPDTPLPEEPATPSLPSRRRAWRGPVAGLTAAAVLGAGAWWGSAGREPAVAVRALGPTDGVVLSLARGAGVEAWSDGRDVWVRLDGAPAVDWTAAVDAPVLDVAVAADGSRLAWSEAGRLIVADRTGARREVAQGAHDPALSPDGRRVAWVSVPVPDPRERAGFDARLGVTDLDTGASRLLLTDVDATQPAFSPDGRRIVFSGGRLGLSTVGADGRSLRTLESAGFAPAWLDAGRVVSAEPLGSGTRVVSTPVGPDGGAAGPPAVLGELPDGWVRSLTPFPDALIATAATEQAGVLRIDLGSDGSERGRAWLAPPDGAYVAPAVATDGRVAAATFRPTESIVTLGPDGQRVRVDGFRFARGPRWLPGGDLVFYGLRDVGRLGVFRVGAEIRPVDVGVLEPLFQAAPSADGLTIATVTESEGALVALRTDAPWDEQLAAQRGSAPTGWFPIEARPDGAWLVTDGHDRLGAWSGGPVTPLWTGSAWGASDPDGAGLWISTGDGLRRVEPASGRQGPTLPVDGRIPEGEGFALAPDGSFLVVCPRTLRTAQWSIR